MLRWAIIVNCSLHWICDLEKGCLRKCFQRFTRSWLFYKGRPEIWAYQWFRSRRCSLYVVLVSELVSRKSFYRKRDINIARYNLQHKSTTCRWQPYSRGHKCAVKSICLTKTSILFRYLQNWEGKSITFIHDFYLFRNLLRGEHGKWPVLCWNNPCGAFS